jgi:hypothetical protein
MDHQGELVLVDELVTAEPGQVTRTSIQLRNTSDRVVHYTLRAVPHGPAASWVKIAPDSIRLLEGDDGQADVFIQPPQGAQSVAGRVPFAIIADPGPDSGLLPTVAEAEVAIGAVHALDARLVPSRARGRFNGKVRVEFTNLGNEEVRIGVTGSDDSDNEVVHFATADGRVSVPSGGSAAAFMKMRPDKPIVIGKPVDHPFVITYTRRAGRSAQMASVNETEVAATVNGVFTQKPIIPKWMMVAGVLLIAIAALLFIVRRASAADPVPPAPGAPTLESSVEADGVLSLVFVVPDNPDHVEVQVVEPPLDGNFDLAVPRPQIGSSVDAGQRRLVELTLDESDDAADVVFRFRSVNANDRPSVWVGSSEVRSSSIAFDAPVIDIVDWNECGDGVVVSWSTPPNSGESTLGYVLRNADTNTLLDGAEIDGNSGRVEVAGPPFAIDVQAFDENDGSRRSLFSEAVSPRGEQPAQCAIPAPTNVNVDWSDDGESLIVSWEVQQVAGRRFVPLFSDEFGNGITNAEQLAGTVYRIPLPRGLLSGIRVQLMDEDSGEKSAMSEPGFPPENRPPPPTTTTTPPETTTTLPPTPKPSDFWILPQGLLIPTPDSQVAWGQIMGSLPREIKAGEADLSDLGDSLENRDVWLYDGFPSREVAEQKCRDFLQGALDLIAAGVPSPDPSACLVVGPDGFASPISTEDLLPLVTT